MFLKVCVQIMNTNYTLYEIEIYLWSLKYQCLQLAQYFVQNSWSISTKTLLFAFKLKLNM